MSSIQCDINNDEPICWHADQAKVITAQHNSRLIVEAGPGTGKTAVACARLSNLINEQDIEPSNTWMISFTRAAVAEIRARLHLYVGDASFSIRIATIDSYAWSMHSGHDPNARLTGTYEENIESVIELLKTDEDIADELSRIEHVVIDEAQDFVGKRADLIEELIAKLSLDCGVTVFADEAQAIYGFSEEEIKDPKAESDRPLLDRLRVLKAPEFKVLCLSEIYRTTSVGLRKIFSELRKEIIHARKHGSTGLHAEMAQKIGDLADRNDLKWSQMKVADFTANDLLLFRTRTEVLMASQFCDLPHRLRLSGYTATLPSWLALCFFDFVEPFLEENMFFDLWSTRIEDKNASEYSPAEAWHRLLRVAGRNDGLVDMKRLRSRLSQSRPPVEFIAGEYGLSGPVVGTIHASKGREASNVILLLSNHTEFENAEDEVEETRVLFVGATRARTSLIVGKSTLSRSSTLLSGRIYRSTKNKTSTMVEIGRAGDLSVRGLVGRSEFSAKDANIAQTFLAKAADVVTTYSLKVDPDLDWCYRIFVGNDGPCVGVLTRNVTNDLWKILKKNQKHNNKPPSNINHVRAQGCATVVLAPDDNDLGTLNEPWASSGFMLAPRISSFPTLFFERSRKNA